MCPGLYWFDFGLYFCFRVINHEGLTEYAIQYQAIVGDDTWCKHDAETISSSYFLSCAQPLKQRKGRQLSTECHSLNLP